MQLLPLLAVGALSMVDGNDACHKLIRGDASMRDTCIQTQVASLNDDKKAYDAKSMLTGVGAAAIPALTTALKDKDAVVRANAADTLGRIGKYSPNVSALPPLVTVLVAALKDDAVSVRRSAAEALANMGTRAKDALPALQAARQDSDPLVHMMAEYGVKKVQGLNPRQ